MHEQKRIHSYRDRLSFPFFLFALLHVIPLSLTAQQNDTLAVLPDTVQSSAPYDTTAKAKSDLEGPIKYWADYIKLKENGDYILLKGNAKLVYQNMTLTAAIIEINRRTNTLYARGVADSLDADSNLVYRDTPVFVEKGDEPIRGDFIEYNFKTRRGKIKGGKTEMEPGYYKGSEVVKIGQNTMLVNTGYFTSCEYIDHPHYYFKSTRMRVKIKDQIIAEPIYFYIADVPLFWLPLGIFPNKKGRHSGLVVPSFGESRVGGRYLRGMGYYWAPNDYFDAEFLTDFYDKLGFAYRARANYKVRYKLEGSVSGEFFPYDLYTGAKKERWSFTFRHNQVIDRTMRISGSGTFVSDKSFANDLSPSQDERLNQNLSSNLSITKSWGSKNNMSINLSRNQNLQTDRIDYTLPNISFNHSRTSIFESITGQKSGAQKSWYENIFFTYNARLINKGSSFRASDSTMQETQQSGMQHRLALSSATQRLFRYINITPSFNYTEDWVNETTEAWYNPDSMRIEEQNKKQFAARRIFNFNVNASTTLYGLFEPDISTLKFVRHKMTPTVDFRFQPDFSEPGYGYVTYLTDSSGTVQKIDRFRNSAFGGTPSSRTRMMSISLRNTFEGKFIDEEGKETKSNLLTANFNTSYNFLADSVRFSRLNTYLSTTIYGKRIDLRLQHSFYKPKKSGVGDSKDFAPLPRLISLNTSFNFNVNNKTFSKLFGKEEKESKQKSKSEETTAKEDDDELGTAQIQQEIIDYREETKKLELPWSASFGLTYSLNYNNVNNPQQRIGFSARVNFHLTKNWKIGWNAHADLVKGEITSQNFNIYRDLHCWEMSIGWQPQIDYYSFRINIKSSVLKDIKLEKRPTGTSRYY